MSATAAPPRTSGDRAATTPATEMPGPPGPGFLQTVLGVMRPITTRVAARRRYGPLFRTNDAIVGRDLPHRRPRADRADVQVEAGAVQRRRAAADDGAGDRAARRSCCSTAQRHLRMRKLMLPPFHGEAIAHYANLIEEIANREIDDWRAGQTIRTRTVAQAITIEVIIRAVFGITDPARIAELKRLLPRLSSPNPFLLLVRKDLGPRSPWGRFVRAARPRRPAALRGDRAAPRGS